MEPRIVLVETCPRCGDEEYEVDDYYAIPSVLPATQYCAYCEAPRVMRDAYSKAPLEDDHG